MEIIFIGIIVSSMLSVFIGMRLCGSCYMRQRYINLEDYDEIV